MDFIKVYKRDYSKPESLVDNSAQYFKPLANDQVLIGTGKGLTKLNTNKNTFEKFPYSIDDAGNYPSAAIRGIDQKGDSVFIATDNGLSLYNARTGSFQRFVNTSDKSKRHELLENHLWFVHYTQPGELIVIGWHAARFDLRTGKCFHKNNSDTSDILYRFSGIQSTFHDAANKKLWLESFEGELYQYDLVARTATRHYYTTDTSIKEISAIHLDVAGKLWLGTVKGLIQYDPVTKKSRAIQLPGSSQNISNIQSHGDETIWAATSKEIIRIERSSGAVSVFNLSTILPHSVIHRRAFMVDDDGNLWVGTTRGFCVVDGKRFRTEHKIPAPHLVSMNVFDKRKTFDRPYYDLDKIELDYNENFFSFDFSSLDFHQTAGIQYAYRLEGFDKDWVNSSKNSASYTNVPPGKYRLWLRSANHAGVWTDAKKPITIVINPPFWKTWWFITLCTLAIAAVAMWFYKQERKRRQQQSIDKTIDYFANSVYGSNSVDEICWDIARNCIAHLKFEDCVVYILDEERRVLQQKAAYGPKNPKGNEIVNAIEIPVGKGIVGSVALTGKMQVIADTTKDTRYIVDDEMRNSELAVPIMHEGKVIGVIDSENRRKNFFTTKHIKAVSTIASISANKIAEAKAEAAANEHRLQLLDIKKLLAESQLMALRAQMNPHFVFNCLNSIQECIVTNKYGEASNYLNKFSKLFRNVLNNSDKNLVTLNAEREVLQLYLELEHMRFEKEFEYRIEVDEELDMEEIQIPSMLIQPYVENALWHGLMHKEGERNLVVYFHYITDDVFQCIIDDNGIGRKRSHELKTQQSKTKRHESKGMRIAKDRIELLQRQGQHARLEIIDKYDEHGKALGTKVVIELSTFL